MACERQLPLSSAEYGCSLKEGRGPAASPRQRRTAALTLRGPEGASHSVPLPIFVFCL